MEQFLEKVRTDLQPRALQFDVYAGELTVTVAPEDAYDVLKNLRDQHGFNYLVDITAVDYFRDEKRFEVAYNVFNLDEKKRIRVKAQLEEDNPKIKSVVSIWPSANWYEREAYDMMGIIFEGHPDLRRIYMPEDFAYFPLRKEFPLIGIPGSIQMPEKDPPKGY
ncbi:MAG: NADH-quinone oxidoreductase subunit C [Bacteroidia bacterium]|nr:NADH-quinone oxidoreductase subunit C [Bacteroidia bacterium]